MAKYSHMHNVEVQLARRWQREEGVSLDQIAKLLRRCPKTVRKNLVATKAGTSFGRRAGGKEGE